MTSFYYIIKIIKYVIISIWFFMGIEKRLNKYLRVGFSNQRCHPALKRNVGDLIDEFLNERKSYKI